MRLTAGSKPAQTEQICLVF